MIHVCHPIAHPFVFLLPFLDTLFLCKHIICISCEQHPSCMPPRIHFFASSSRPLTIRSFLLIFSVNMLSSQTTAGCSSRLSLLVPGPPCLPSASLPGGNRGRRRRPSQRQEAGAERKREARRLMRKRRDAKRMAESKKRRSTPTTRMRMLRLFSHSRSLWTNRGKW